MKAKLEGSAVQYRGIIVESETDEEKEVLVNIWNTQGLPVAIGRAASPTHLGFALTIAPYPDKVVPP